MPDLSLILQKWWKGITALTIAALLVALVVLLLLPKQYLSTATALPANSLIADKGSVFSSNIQQLYSSLGSPGELDRFIGTARLDTVYIAVASQHNLVQHYDVKKDPHELYNAALLLKKNTGINRTEYGELQVKVWDQNPEMAATLANSLLQALQQLHQQLQSQSNALVLQNLKTAYAGLNDSSKALVNSLPAGAAQMEQYEKLVAEYNLMVQTNPPTLLVVERARPAIKWDKPAMLPILLLTFFAALLFGFLMALLLEKRNTKNV